VHASLSDKLHLVSLATVALCRGIVAGPPTVHAALVAAVKAVEAQRQRAAEGNASSSDYSEND
jgi:hypothetical protein